MTSKKKILIPCNVIDYTGSPGHVVRDTYVRALIEISGCLPLFLPAVGSDADLKALAAEFDGILLTGSPAHVAPACYGEPQEFEDSFLDLARDSTTLPLISHAIALDKPLIAICRGFQELNVARGGSLTQKVHEQPGMLDHRPREGAKITEAYETQAHKVTRKPGGIFEKLGLPETFTVNSVHQQGVKRLGDGLTVEAVAEDGLIEAVSVTGKKFILGTQWHPEGDWKLNATSKRIFEGFRDAVCG